MIGVLGGTFDPIHFGHLRPALEVFERIGLSELRFVPCRLPPHRQLPVASALQRLAMVRAAISPQRGFRVDDREIRREGPSYMVDTLNSLRAELGSMPLCLILGSDAFAGLSSWHRWERIPELAHIVVMQRPGEDDRHAALTPELRQLVGVGAVDDHERLRAAPAGTVVFVPVTQIAISATAIRKALAVGRSIRYLVPESVRQLITAQSIYG